LRPAACLAKYGSVQTHFTDNAYAFALALQQLRSLSGFFHCIEGRRAGSPKQALLSTAS